MQYSCSSVRSSNTTEDSTDIGGKFDELISIVMDDPGFIEAHRHEGVSDEVFLIRCGDYAANEVFKAYTNQ